MPPPQLVRRDALHVALDVGAEGRTALVLLSAPAGYGKSTLVAAWVADSNRATAWLQLDESDNDPARYWADLVTAVGQARRAQLTGVGAAASGSNGDGRVVVPALVNALAADTAPLVIVLDDYHLIDNVAVHRDMERFIELCLQQVTVVLITRTDPPFRLGRLRVRNQLAEIRGGDLRFVAKDAPVLIGAAAAALEPEQVEQLCARTEGWAAGLVLAGLSLKNASDPAHFIERFHGDDQLVVEYLHEELLTGLDPIARQRLLETSVLDELSGSLVDALTGAADGAAWLRRTAADNQLLICLDQTNTWFRYHHLLRDLLRLEAEQVIADRLPQLNAQVADWFEKAGDVGGALRHRLAAGQMDAAARLLGLEGPRLLARGQSETLLVLLNQLGSTARTTPWCLLMYAWCEFFGGRYARSDTWLDLLAAASPGGQDQPAAVAVRMNNSLARGDLATALDAARRTAAAGALAEQAATLVAVAGVVFACAGEREQARQALQLAARKAVDDDLPSVHLMALTYQALVEFLDGPTSITHAAADAAVAAAEATGLAEFHGVAAAYAIRGRTRDDEPGARADVAHALVVGRRASTPLALGFVLTACADTLLALGDSAGQNLLLEARAVLGTLTEAGTIMAYLSLTEARHGAAVPAPRAPALVEQLTDREAAVLRYLPSKNTQRDIARELYVSLNTVKTHCKAIYRKLDASNRQDAVQAARELRLL